MTSVRFSVRFLHCVLFNVYDARNDVLPCWIGPTNCQPKRLRTKIAEIRQRLCMPCLNVFSPLHAELDLVRGAGFKCYPSTRPVGWAGPCLTVWYIFVVWLCAAVAACMEEICASTTIRAVRASTSVWTAGFARSWKAWLASVSAATAHLASGWILRLKCLCLRPTSQNIVKTTSAEYSTHFHQTYVNNALWDRVQRSRSRYAGNSMGLLTWCLEKC